MDPRERWQALHAHLTAARAALDAGDKHGALAEVDAALAIDPNFLAAHSLRDRVLAAPPPRPAAAAPIVDALPIAAIPAIAEPLAAPAAPAKRPLVSTAGYAQFEQRAKRRRVDHRIDAARAAMQRGRLKQAAAALDEVIDLDPNLPELTALTVEFDELRRMQASTHRGPWMAAAAVFAMTLFGATWLHDTNALLSRATSGAVPLLSAPVPSVAVSASEPEPIATSGSTDTPQTLPVPVPFEPIERRPRPVEAIALPEQPAPIRMSPPRVAVAELPPASASPAPINQPLLPRAVTEPPAVPPSSAVSSASSSASMSVPLASPAAAPAAFPAASPVARIDDESLVKQTLQQYRRAYEGLDAQSARAVYPAINEAALARAFDGLTSQSLTFDKCDVRMNGAGATATCRGSARYVPKVGSREPHTEPRTWNFTLRKNGADWQIENARAER